MRLKKFLCKVVAVVLTAAIITGYGGVINTDASEYNSSLDEAVIKEETATETDASAEEGGFTYDVLDETEKTIEITGYTGSETELEIPETIDGYTVTSIGDYAFEDCFTHRYESIIIPDSVTSIGDYAFDYCNYLTSMVIPDSVTSIGDYAFYNCDSLTSIELSENLTSIGKSAFRYCNSITGIEIPDGVTSIGYKAFSGCDSLTGIIVSEDNANYSSQDGVLYNKDKTELICCPAGKTGSFEVPSNVTTIGEGAFSYCINITSIVIPDSVTSIGEYAFESCETLASINIPSGVTVIEEGTFDSCYSLTGIDIPSGVTSIGTLAFFESGITSITLPDGVTSIGDRAFKNCANLTSIDIPDSVTSIGGGAFELCLTLASIDIPSGVTSIEYNTFFECESLVNVEIPSGVTSIGDAAFYFCKSLVSVTIPESVTSIEENAFGECANLADIYYAGSKTQWNKISLDDTWNYECPDDMEIHYAKASAVLDTPALNKTTPVSGGVKVSWSKVSGATGYVVFRKTSSGSWKRLGATTSTSYTDKTATAGTTYYYTVRAYKGSLTTADKNKYNTSKYWSSYENPGVTGKYIKTPTIKSATATATGTTIKWSSISGATGYAVWRKVNGGSWSRIGYTTSTSYTDKTTLISGATYYYCIRAYSGEYATANANTFDSTYWSTSSSSKKIVYLSKPTLKSTSAVSGGVKVSWSKVTGATGYAVYRKTSGGSWKMLGTTTSLSYTDKKATAGTTYYYTVRAYKGSVTTAKKNTYNALYWGGYNSTGVKGKYIKTPTIKSATATATGTTIKWSSVSGVTGYAIWRKANGGSWSRIGYTTSTSYTDKTALTSGTTYYYCVRAYSGEYATANANTFASTYWSASSSGKKIVYLSKPTLKSATETSAGKVKVTWSKVTGASGYVVYRKTSGGSWKLLGNTTSTSYTDKSTLTDGTTYYYTVRAYKGAYATAKKNTYNAAYWGGYNSTGVSVKYKDIKAQEYAEEVADLVNEQRTANGLSEVTLDATLTEAAMARAKECAKSFSHTRPDGTSCFTILDEYSISYSSAGENIAAGYTSSSAVMAGWMNSSGHKANILGSGYTKIGVGYYKDSSGTTYWVQIFTS